MDHVQSSLSHATAYVSLPVSFVRPRYSLKTCFFVTLISTGGLFMLNGKNRLFRCVALAVASRVFLTMYRYVRLEASVDPPARKIGQNATAKR